MPQVCQQEG